MNAHFDPSKRLGEYHKQTTPAIWEHQSNPPTRWIGRAWSKSLISARRPRALKGKPRRTSISDTQCLTLNRDRDYELPAVFNFSFLYYETFLAKGIIFFRSYLALLMVKTYGYQLELLYSESGRCLAESDL